MPPRRHRIQTWSSAPVASGILRSVILWRLGCGERLPVYFLLATNIIHGASFSVNRWIELHRPMSRPCPQCGLRKTCGAESTIAREHCISAAQCQRHSVYPWHVPWESRPRYRQHICLGICVFWKWSSSFRGNICFERNMLRTIVLVCLETICWGP